MRYFLLTLLTLLGIGAQAASPTFNQFSLNQFRTNGNFLWIKPGSLQTNNIFYPASSTSGAFGTPLYRFEQPNSQTFWLSNASVGAIWTWDNSASTFYFNQGDVSFPDGVIIGGVRRTTWPSGGSGSQTPWLQDIDAATFSLTNLQKLLITNNDVAIPFMTMTPSADPQQRGTGGLLWSVQYFTNPGGDSNDNKVFINGGFNSGVGGTQIDGREPTFAPVWETWWNGAGVEPEGHQMEIYDLYRSPSNAITVRPRGLVLRGTNSIQHTVNGSQWVFNGFRSPHAVDQLLISDGAPTTTNGGVSVIASGVITTVTNSSNNGGFEVEGGTIKVGAPDSVSANNMFLRVDWNNGFSSVPNAVIYPSGVSKELQIGHATAGANQFTNLGIYASTKFDGSLVINSNTAASIWTHPNERGQVQLWNSNGTMYVLTASLSSLTWASTNTLLGSGGGGSVTYANGQALASTTGDSAGNLHYAEGSVAMLIDDDSFFDFNATTDANFGRIGLGTTFFKPQSAFEVYVNSSQKQINVTAAGSSLTSPDGAKSVNVVNGGTQVIGDFLDSGGVTPSANFGNADFPTLGNRVGFRITTMTDGRMLVMVGTNVTGVSPATYLATNSAFYFGWETNTALANSFKSTNALIAVGGIHATQANNTINPLAGTIAADNAPAGTYGEYIESKIASGSAVSLTTATAANITSISLTAGDWDVRGNVNIVGGTATYTQGAAAINTTSATLATDGTEVYSSAGFTLLSVNDGIALPPKRINVSSTTTVYLVGRATFSAGTMTGYGTISARRVR